MNTVLHSGVSEGWYCIPLPSLSPGEEDDTCAILSSQPPEALQSPE